MKKNLMGYFFQISIRFRKVTNRKKILDVIQFFVDILIGYECIFPLSLSYEYFALTILFVVLAKIILHVLKRDSVGNFIGIILNTLFVIMSLLFELGFPIASIIAYIVHILRIKSCYIDEKLKDVYGYPNFNFEFMENELSKNEIMANQVQFEYDKVFSDVIIKFSIIESCCSVIIQLSRVISIVVICIGLLLFDYGINNINAYNSSIEVTSLSRCEVNTNITGTVYELYDNCVTGLSKNTNDGYWGKFGNELVLFVVPETYKSSFAKLYNFYATKYDLVKSDNSDISSQEGIIFHGKLLDSSDCEFPVEVPYFDENGLSFPEINTTYFILVIDNELMKSVRNIGICLLFLGFLILIITTMLIYRKMKNCINFSSKLF